MLDRIREILSVRQLTPTQFADSIGVARPIISHILSGRNKPSLEVVQKIVAAFPDLSLPWLLNGTGAMQAEKTTPTPVPTPPSATPARRAGAKAPEATRLAPSVVASHSELVNSKAALAEAFSDASAPLSVPEVPLVEPGPDLPLFTTSQAAGEPLAPNKPANAAASPNSKLEPLAYVGEATPYAPATPSTANQQPVSSAVESQNAVAAAPSNLASSTVQPFINSHKAIRRIVIFYQDGSFTDYQPELS